MADEDYVRLAPACGCGSPAKPWNGRGRKPSRCSACAALKASTGVVCLHEKPALKNGRLRAVCYACVPKPEAKPRKAQEARYLLTCERCLAPFWSKLPAARSCSRGCRISSGNAAATKRAEQAHKEEARVVKCAGCGHEFCPLLGRGSSTVVRCKPCQRKQRQGLNNPARARRRGLPRLYFDEVAEVLERDGWRCMICGADAPKQLRGTTSPNAPEVDHIIPLAALGSPGHTPANCQCACRACNSAKGAKLPSRLALAAS